MHVFDCTDLVLTESLVPAFWIAPSLPCPVPQKIRRVRFKVGAHSQEYGIITGFSMAIESHTFKGMCYPLRTIRLVAH